MAKIIGQVSKLRTTTHSACGSIIEYSIDEVQVIKELESTDIDHGPGYQETFRVTKTEKYTIYHSLSCPKCYQTIKIYNDTVFEKTVTYPYANKKWSI